MLYVAAVIDLFSRRVVGWSMKAEMSAQLVEYRRVVNGDLAARAPGCAVASLRQSEDKRQFPGGPALIARGASVRLAPRGALCGLTHTQIDQPCLSPDLSTARERLAGEGFASPMHVTSRSGLTLMNFVVTVIPVHAFGPGEAIDARSTWRLGNGGHRRRYVVSSAASILSYGSSRSAAIVDEQDRIIGTRSPSPRPRQGYRQMLAWMRSFGELQRIGIESTGS